MPYILLVIGCLIGLVALYRFMLNATVGQIKALFLSSLLVTLVVALFYMAVTGRLAAALGLMVAITPILFSLYKQWRGIGAQAPLSESTEINSRSDALAVLGLKEDADEEAIKAAYKTLMQKIHPDHEGSEWMAAKLNEARDLLLKK
jgi:hypothetical protein